MQSQVQVNGRVFGRKLRASGQAIIEGTVMLVVCVPLAVGLILLLINVGYVFMYQQKLNMVAEETAKYMLGRQFFLGYQLPNNGTAEHNATLVCQELLNQIGMPPGEVTFQAARPVASIPGGPVIRHCTVKVKGLRMFGGGVFPSLIAMTGSGFAVQDAGTGSDFDGKYMIARLAITSEDGGQRWIYHMPVYCIERDNVGVGGGFYGGAHFPGHYREYAANAQGNFRDGPNGFRRWSATPGGPTINENGW